MLDILDSLESGKVRIEVGCRGGDLGRQLLRGKHLLLKIISVHDIGGIIGVEANGRLVCLQRLLPSARDFEAYGAH